MAMTNNNSSRFITEQQFFQDFKRVDLSTLPIEPSYTEFLRFFNKLSVITRHDMIIGINFTYGWMPTIFEFKSDSFTEAVRILNLAKQGVMLKEVQLTLLMSLFNNSLVGTTKLLHFINPKRYAIWDSRVHRYFTNEESHQYRVGNCKRYLLYMNFCNNVTKNGKYKLIHELVCKQLGYRVSRLRSIELLMYLQGGNNR